MWQDEVIPLVRLIVGDSDTSSLTYSDFQIEQLAVAAARTIISEVDFPNTYTLSVANSTISPDPTSGTEDSAFINLVSLRTAALIVGAEVKKAANQAYVIKDGPSTIDTRANYQSMLETHKRLVDDYERAKIAYQAGNSKAGHAIMNGYINENVNPQWGSL